LHAELGVTLNSRKKVNINDNDMNGMSVSGENNAEMNISSLANIEKQHIQRVLNETSWRRTEAAKILGINRTTLYNKIKEYGISPS
jgi:DNA-binding NtrC family response regulator